MRHKFPKGHKFGGNKKGKKYFSVSKLFDELEKEAEAQGKSFYQHIAQRCYKSDDVLKKVMDKFIPDLSEVETEVNIKFINQIPRPEIEGKTVIETNVHNQVEPKEEDGSESD